MSYRETCRSMNRVIAGALACFLCTLGAALPLAAQDNVTIPKSRLQELEEKERELNRLKGDLKETQDENAQLKREQQQAATNTISTPPPPPPVAHVSPALVSLPPLKESDQVEAVDLANYYRADAAAAEARFRRHKFFLRGQIVGFEKPLFRRDYRVLLKTADSETRIICNFYPPDEYNSVVTTDHGSQLVATMGQTRVPLAKVGQTVLMHAECKGWKDSCLMISAGGMQSVAPVKTD